MFKKLFLTGIFVVSTSVPVLSYGDYITNSSSCDYATLNTYTSANLSAVFEPNNYTITYSCGSALQGSASTPSGPTTSSSTFTMDTPYTLAAADNCSLAGYTFAGWYCPNLPGTPTLPVAPATPLYFAGGANGTYSYAGNITCTAQWTPNSVALSWDANGGSPTPADSSCVYDQGITLPTPPPSRTGYTFGGWRVGAAAAQCVLSQQYVAAMDNETPDFDPQYVKWEPIAQNGYTMAEAFDDENLTSGLNAGEWSVTYTEGTIKGRALCSSTNGTYATTGIPNETGGGQYCWCAGTDFGNSCHVASPSWVFRYDYNDGYADSCARVCASLCAGDVYYESAFRRAIFGVTTP